jgi:DNA-binding XRE family transcriptional regulator
MIAPAQLRAARALLDWSRADCGTASGVSPETIKNIEKERFQPGADTL